MDYKFNQQAGALNEIAPAPRAKRAMPSSVAPAPAQDYVSAHDSSIVNLNALVAGAAPVHAQSVRDQIPAQRMAVRSTGLDPQSQRTEHGMFFYTVREGERVRVIHKSGRIDVVQGPSRIWRSGRTIEPMAHYVAHPGEFLIVRFRDGRQEHLAGPAHIWFDPRDHLSVSREESLQIAAKEAVVVYSRDPDSGGVSRRVVHGPATFIPAPGEWLHTFSWHGSRGGDDGYQKVPNALVFQKLWFLPDQMYHDVNDVRTADDAVITVRLMIFFQLVDLDKMLASTHDPIGDFVNAATSDVIDFTSRHDLESFKRHTERLNDLGTYAQLSARGEQCGYRIDKVVYRGYGAPENLQRMHDEAIESRTKLQLERATQQQAQDLADFKLERDMGRQGRLRAEQDAAAAHELTLAERRREAELRDQRARRDFSREQSRHDAEQQSSALRQHDQARLAHLDDLHKLGVDLTAYLTQHKADRVIEVRGGSDDVHLHLDAEQTNKR